MIEVTWTLAPPPAMDDVAVQRAAEAALEEGGRAGVDLAVVFVDDATLTEMHGTHLDDPTPTDVLSFDLGEETAGPVGELYISVERARIVALERGVPLSRELALYVVHGTLHLCGYDDHDAGERAQMRAAEGRVLAALGYPPDTAPHEASS